jgi:hypothetical protein
MAVAMNTNLVLTTGLAYASLGACVMFVSHRAIYNTASRVVAGYPRVLTALRAKRHICGIILQVLGASGYSAPLSLWRYPASAALAALVLYGVCRGVASRRIAAAPARPAAARSLAGGLYETRRSMRLREAAQIEAANREQRERARGPRDRSVVYIRQDWERRWWSDKLGVSSDALEAAVRHAGPMIKDVEQYLSTRRAGNHALAA